MPRVGACLSIVGLLGCLVLPVAAQACDPIAQEVSLVPEEGHACALAWQPEEDTRVALLGARNMDQPVILQDLVVGNACDEGHRLVVHDCASDRVLVIGHDQRVSGYPEGHELNSQGLEELARQVLTEGAGLDDLQQNALSSGYADLTLLDIGEAIEIAGVAVPLGCVCERVQRIGGE